MKVGRDNERRVEMERFRAKREDWRPLIFWLSMALTIFALMAMWATDAHDVRMSMDEVREGTKGIQ